jgi:hypothetical protein
MSFGFLPLENELLKLQPAWLRFYARDNREGSLSLYPKRGSFYCYQTVYAPLTPVRQNVVAVRATWRDNHHPNESLVYYDGELQGGYCREDTLDILSLLSVNCMISRRCCDHNWLSRASLITDSVLMLSLDVHDRLSSIMDRKISLYRDVHGRVFEPTTFEHQLLKIQPSQGNFETDPWVRFGRGEIEGPLRAIKDMRVFRLENKCENAIKNYILTQASALANFVEDYMPGLPHEFAESEF